MRIGDLSRARAPVESRSRTPFLALSLTLATSVLLAGWLALPSSSRKTDVAAASGQDAAVSRIAPSLEPPRAPAPTPTAPPMRVADAGSGVAYGGSSSSPMLAADPVSTNAPSEPVAVPVQAPEAPEQAQVAPSTPEIAEPTEVASVTGAATESAPADDPQGSARVDLNTAPLEDLNSLRGGGRIGRAIVRGRPYASVEDLVKKRILSRSVYARIKDQVTAR